MFERYLEEKFKEEQQMRYDLKEIKTVFISYQVPNW